MKERIEALVQTMRCHGCEQHVTLPRVESRLQIGNFMCRYMKRLITTNGVQFKFHLPVVFAWSFLFRLEHLAVRITSTIKHSLRFQQQGAIEQLLEWIRLISNFSAVHYNNTQTTLRCNKQSEFSLEISHRTFEKSELSLLSSQLTSVHSEISFVISFVESSFAAKFPQKAKKFVEVRLRYFCTIL